MTLSSQRSPAEINFKQTLVATYNYHCSFDNRHDAWSRPLNIASVLEVTRSLTSIIVGCFRIARDSIEMICYPSQLKY